MRIFVEGLMSYILVTIWKVLLHFVLLLKGLSIAIESNTNTRLSLKTKDALVQASRWDNVAHLMYICTDNLFECRPFQSVFLWAWFISVLYFVCQVCTGIFIVKKRYCWQHYYYDYDYFLFGSSPTTTIDGVNKQQPMTWLLPVTKVWRSLRL